MYSIYFEPLGDLSGSDQFSLPFSSERDLPHRYKWHVDLSYQSESWYQGASEVEKKLMDLTMKVAEANRRFSQDPATINDYIEFQLHLLSSRVISDLEGYYFRTDSLDTLLPEGFKKHYLEVMASNYGAALNDPILNVNAQRVAVGKDEHRVPRKKLLESLHYDWIAKWLFAAKFFRKAYGEEAELVSISRAQIKYLESDRAGFLALLAFKQAQQLRASGVKDNRVRITTPGSPIIPEEEKNQIQFIIDQTAARRMLLSELAHCTAS